MPVDSGAMEVVQDHDDCVLCGQAAKSVDHLILGHVFTRKLWCSLLSPIGLAALVPVIEDDIAAW